MYMIELGSSNYKEFIEENRYYIDKTLFIEDILEKVGKVVLITRPRRFGKTLNLSMLEYYFDISKNSEHLFKGKKIEQESFDLYKKYLNNYPVIFLTLKEIKGTSFDNIYSSFKTKISDLYNKYEYLKDNLSTANEQLFDKMLTKKGDIGEYKNSVYKLSEFLYKYYDKKVIILLDEYDSMVNSLLDKEIYKDVIDLLRGLIGNAFKGNDYLEKGVLTGILRIAKEELFSGANNIEIITIMSDDFNDKFGFTEQEVIESLEQFNLKDNAIEVKNWYNGYIFGSGNKITIYNPFSIANYLKKKEIKNYWVNTGSDAIIKNLLLDSSYEVKKSLDSLLKNETINVTVKENISMSNIKNRDYLWSLLLFSGYLKPIQETDHNKYDLALVNNEVINSMNELVEEYFTETMEPDEILKAIKEGDIETFAEELASILLTSVNNIDLINENSYHTFLLGMSVVLRKYYIIRSNESSGKGRYDISIASKDNKQGYIVELKNTKDEKEDLKKLSMKALNQIETNVYYIDLKSRSVEKIYLVGIAFHKKDFAISYKTI